MPFDPDTYIAGISAPAQAPASPAVVPAAFDPDTYIAGTKFNPNEFLGKNLSAQDRMQALAPLVAKPDADKADEAAYKSAYTQYYDQNHTLNRVGQTLKDVVGSATKIGGAIWDMAKGAVKTASNLPMPGVGGYVPETGNPLDDVKAAGQGMVSGARSAYMLGQSLSEKAMEQINNVVADTGLDPSFRDQAAQLAVDRLKLNQRSAILNANPYNEHTDPQRAALFDTASAGGSLAVPGVGAVGDAAAKGAQVAGDIIENGAYKMIGAGAKMVPPMVKGAEAAGVAYGLAHGVAAAPVKTIGGAVLAGLTGKTSAIFSKGQAIQSGLFSATNAAADVALATPLGQSALDSVVQYAPLAIKQAEQDLAAIRAAASQATADRTAALPLGKSTIPFDKTIKQLAQQESAANFRVEILNRGASMARGLQRLGVAGIPGKLADATAGAIQGGLLGGIVAASNAQPGDDSTISNGASKGAAYGSILSMLGTASAASQSKGGPSFQQRSQQAIQQMQGNVYPSPIGPPAGTSAWAQLQAANARLQGGKAGAGIANVRLKPQPGAPTVPVTISGTPGGVPASYTIPVSPLRQIANEKATNVFLDATGVPHDTNELADAIKQTAGGVVEAAKKEIPGQAYTYKIAQPRQVTGPNGTRTWAMPAGGQMADHLFDWHATNTSPVSSNAFEGVSYHPESHTMTLTMKKKDGYQHYALHEVTPQDFADFLAGKDAEGSMGKHFNSILRNEHPYYHIQDPRFIPATTPKPAPPSGGSAIP